MRISHCGILFVGLALFSTTSARAAPETIRMPYGLTKTALLPNGLDGTAVLARRASHDAQGFDVLTVYVQQTTSESDPYGFLLVPFFDKDKERLEVTTGGNAECQVRGFRMLRTDSKDVQVVTAERDPGKGMSDFAKVTFKYFEIVHNPNGPGRPTYYFEAKKTVAAKQTYCDVDEAFKVELNLDPYQAD